MKVISKAFTPTSNRRLNELIGFVLCVFAGLLFLALVSYSPQDASWNSSESSAAEAATGYHNWIGMVGSYAADLAFQGFGVAAFLIAVFPAILGIRWFVRAASPPPSPRFWERLPCCCLFPRCSGCCPGTPVAACCSPGGLLGRILGDFLVHYLNLVARTL